MVVKGFLPRLKISKTREIWVVVFAESLSLRALEVDFGCGYLSKLLAFPDSSFQYGAVHFPSSL